MKTHKNTSALVLAKDGQIVFEYGSSDQKYWSHSIRKSFLSALIGIAIEKKLLTLSDRVGDYEFLQAFDLSKIEKSATIEDLISSRSGIFISAAAADRETPARHQHRPGEIWFYNNWDFNVTQHILENLTGKSVFKLFDEWIARTLKMNEFSPEDCKYVGNPEDVALAGFFRISSRDLLQFGELYRNNGVLKDRRILTSEWIAQSTTLASKTDIGNGYGYMWWTDNDGVSIPGLKNSPEDLFYAWGWGGHYLIVIPSAGLTVVHRVDTDITSDVNPVSHEEFALVLEDAIQKYG